MENQSIITVRTSDQAAGAAAMFPAVANEHVAHELFLFLAKNLKPGFEIELAANGRSITQPSEEGKGGKRYYDLLAALAQFAAHDDGGQLDAFMGGYAGEEWAAVTGRPLLPDCPICGEGGHTVHHADSSDERIIYQCLNCGRIGYA